MEMMQAFDADAQLLPHWVQLFMNWIGLVLFLSTLVFLIFKGTRGLGLFMLVSTVAGVMFMMWMHSQMGMVRLLGIVHVVIWTPLVVYFWKRLQAGGMNRVVTIAMWTVMATMVVALVFDYYDVLRWIFGNRAPVVNAA